MTLRGLALLFFMLTGAAWAQAPEDPTARIAWLQEAENSLLIYQRTLLDREADLAEPLWIASEDGVVTVVDGGPIYDNAALLAELAASYAIDETLGPDAHPVARTVAEMVAAGRVRNVRDAVKSAYEDPANAVRAAALAEIERQLETVRAAVVATLEERDGTGTTAPVPVAEDWRARLARAGAGLPVPEGNLLKAPVYDAKRCDISPVYIEVRGEGRSKACTGGGWRYLGGGLTMPKGTGRCVWCPSGYRWRSGIGCCYPE